MMPPVTGKVPVNEHVPEAVADVNTASGGAGPAIEVSHLHKIYGETVAVEDVSFSVAEGQIFGLLGPNGAGKTTTVECAVGLRRADSGQVRILGLDSARDRERLRLAVGVQLQSSALPAKLKVGELLDLYQSFYPEPADVDELAETLGLADKRDDYYQSLSGGQKQRLSIALALIGQPKVAVLDEMTTGLDPHARRDTWDLIGHVRDRGVTILLVTHYMEEAERLCDEGGARRPREGRGGRHARGTGAARRRKKAGALRSLPAVRRRPADRPSRGVRRRAPQPAPAGERVGRPR